MKRSLMAILCLVCMNSITAQVAITTDASAAHSSAMLDIKSNSKGLLPPRMSWTQIQAIQNPAEGLLVYDVGLKAYRMFNGNAWVVLGIKTSSLTDPPGYFSNYSGKSPSQSSRGLKIKVGPDKKVYVSGVVDQTLIFGTDTLTGSNNMFFAVFDSLGNYIFSKKFGGGTSEQITDLAVNATGIYIGGYFIGTTDLDPGPGTDNHFSSFTTPFFVKFDLNGNLVWGRHLSGNSTAQLKSLAIDANGLLYISVDLSGTLNVDPTGLALITSSGNFDVLFAKYSSSGNLVWARKIGGGAADITYGLVMLNSSIVFAGMFSGLVDFDPSGAAFNLVSAGVNDFFLTRFDTSGNLLWAKQYGSTGTETFTGQRLTLDNSGNICLAGIYAGTIDINPDVGTQNFTSNGGVDIHVGKYSGAGALLPGSFSIGGTIDDVVSDIRVDEFDNLYVVGMFGGTVDFDPVSFLAQNLVSVGSTDIFLAKYSPSAAIVFAKNMGGASFDGLGGVAPFAGGKIIFVTGGSTAPYLTFNGDRVMTTGFFLARYEE